jgi:hypothetical protein
MQDVNTVAQLRNCGLPLDTILGSKVHGRGGLQSRYLRRHEVYRDGSAPIALPARSGSVLDPNNTSWNVDALLEESGKADAAHRAAGVQVTSFCIKDLGSELGDSGEDAA